jgi:hypothetical protein
MSTAEERMQNEIDELEQENRLLRARNTRLEAEAKVVSVQPVATVQCINGVTIGYLDVMQPVGTKLYTTPPAAQRQWVELTDRQIESIFLDAGWSWGEKADMYVPAVREVLKLFKETNE